MQTWRNPKLSTILWLAALAWCGALFYFSGQSGAESSALSLRFTRLVLRLFPALPWSAAKLHPLLRKFAHFAIFAAEGALLGGAMLTSLRRHFPACAAAILGCLLLAALNEFHQSFHSGRSCELRDVLIDTLGGITGTLLALAALRIGFALAEKLRRRRQML